MYLDSDVPLVSKKENPHSDTFLHLNEGSLHSYRLFFYWNNSIIALGVVAAVHMVADKWHTVPNIEYHGRHISAKFVIAFHRRLFAPLFSVVHRLPGQCKAPQQRPTSCQDRCRL